MIDVIRVKLPGGVKRFPMFSVQDYLSFLLTNADMEGKTPEEQQTILDELLDILYPGYSKTEQENIFTKVYCSSFGKNAIKIQIRGKGKSGATETFMVITDYELQNEYQISEDVTMGFRFPDTRKFDETVFAECISYVIHKEQRYEWSALNEETKNEIIDLVGMEDIENIFKMLKKSCHVEIRKNVISSLLPLFKTLFSKGELNEFFKTNFLLNKHNVHIEPMMKVTPMERSIYVALLAEDLKEK